MTFHCSYRTAILEKPHATRYKRGSGNFSYKLDDDFEEPRSKRMPSSFEAVVNPIRDDNAAVKKSLDELVKIAKLSKIPMGLKMLTHSSAKFVTKQ